MKQEKGLTLIELLVTISILLIISSVIYGVFIGINKNYRQLSGNSNLEQEANIILTTIKNYQLKNSTYVVTYDSNKKVYLIGNSSPTQQLGSTNLNKLTIDDGNGPPVIPNTPSIKFIDTTKSKSITVHIEMTNGYQFDTIVKRY